jgi:hypothetical protein
MMFPGEFRGDARRLRASLRQQGVVSELRLSPKISGNGSFFSAWATLSLISPHVWIGHSEET